jgi:hypothetical protein
MTIINQAACAEKIYIVSIGTGLDSPEKFKVYAHNDKEALNRVADYIESKEMKNIHFDAVEMYAIAQCSNRKPLDIFDDLDKFAAEKGLTRCGTHHIYIELSNIEEVSE